MVGPERSGQVFGFLAMVDAFLGATENRQSLKIVLFVWAWAKLGMAKNKCFLWIGVNLSRLSEGILRNGVD